MVNIGCKKIPCSILVIRESLISSYLALSELRYWNKRGVMFATNEGRSSMRERLNGVNDNLTRLHPNTNLSYRFHFVIMYIISLFSCKRKYQFQQLSGYRYQCLFLYHSIIYKPMVILMHNSIFSYYVQRSKKQYLPEKRPATLGYMSNTFLVTGTYLIKIQPGKFYNSTLIMKIVEVSHFSDYSSCGYFTYPFYGQYILTLWNLFQIMIHLRFYFIYKIIEKGYLFYYLLNSHNNTIYTFFNSNGIICSIVKSFRMLNTKSSSACFPKTTSKRLKTKVNNVKRRRVVFQKIHRTFTAHCFHNLQKFRENHINRSVESVYRHSPVLYRTFTRINQISQLSRRSFRYNKTQVMSQLNNICYNFRIFLVRFKRRIVIQLFNSLCMCRIYLNQFYRLIDKVMYQRLLIRTGRLKTYYYVISPINNLGSPYLLPKSLESICIISKFKWFYTNIIITPISSVFCHSNINRGNHHFFVDYLNLFCFISHGYTPYFKFNLNHFAITNLIKDIAFSLKIQIISLQYSKLRKMIKQALVQHSRKWESSSLIILYLCNFWIPVCTGMTVID